MTYDATTNALILLPLILQLIGLVFVVLADRYIIRSHKIIMMIITGLVFLLVAQNVADAALIAAPNPPVRTLVGIWGYALRPLILVVFFYIVDPDKDYNRAWILIIINTVVQLTALFSGIAFSIDGNNHFHRGPLGYVTHIISGLLLIQLLYRSVREYGRIRKFNLALPVMNTVLIVGAVVADAVGSLGESPVSFLTIAVVSCCVFYYIWLHLLYVVKHDIALETEQRIQIMMSQIQPHFLFNTLSTIQALCRIDPEQAADTVEKFGTYLRQNLESLDQTDLIPFEKELEHVRLYADIEQIRFPSIAVEYRIEDRDFELPALSIQPLVENAIRHGVRIRENGRITVRSWRDLDAHVITITDNGTGFDVAKLETADSSHIGIRNVRERIEKMCGGTLDITSATGEGTSVTVKIPIEGGSR